LASEKTGCAFPLSVNDVESLVKSDVSLSYRVLRTINSSAFALRREVTRKGLVPVPGAVETIATLRERGLKTGLITVCSEDIELLWPESAFAGLFDAEIFSSRVGLSKPDPRIYLACCEALGVEPHEAVFVGDGANDELEGARRVGMDAILIHREGEDPLWGLDAWDGPRVTSIPGVLDVLAA